MARLVNSIETELIDLSQVSLDSLLTYDHPDLTRSLARLLVEVENPRSSVGNDDT